jgi:heme-degrading monooxygenase HmoA
VTSRFQTDLPHRAPPTLRRDLIIIAGYELVNAKDRDGYVAAFVASSRVPASSMGAFTSITADSVDPERVDSVEVWRDAEALNEWRKASQGSAHEETQALGSATVRRHRRRPPSSESVGTFLSRHGDSPRPIDQGGSAIRL